MKGSVWKIDLVIVGISLIVLLWSVGYARPLVVAPLDNYESVDGDILFEFERADVLLIDDNMDFSTPEEYRVVDGERIELEPGVYYWKVIGVLKSEIRKLTIQSRVELKLVEREGNMTVVNVGNVRLNVDVYDGEELIGRKRLDIGEESGEGDKFVGEYDG